MSTDTVASLLATSGLTQRKKQSTDDEIIRKKNKDDGGGAAGSTRDGGSDDSGGKSDDNKYGGVGGSAGGFPAVVVPVLKGVPKIVQEYSKPLFAILTKALPIVVKFVKYLHSIWIQLPHTSIRLLCGFVFCFYGGTFPTLFAAIQAAEHGGRTKFVAAISDLAEEALLIIEENKKDNELDEDHNGIRDVEEISKTELYQRKLLLFLRKMHPDKLNAAFTSLNTVWFSVAAVLRVQFAQTISMSLSIAEFVSQPSKRFIEPIIKEATPPEYQKWVPVVMEWIIKGSSMMFAWYISTILVAFTSSLQGGLIISRALYDIIITHIKHNEALHKDVGGGFGMIYDFTDKLPDSNEESNLDESISYIFAVWGFYAQFKRRFRLTYPLNLLLWPFQIVEFWIKWTITYR